jgi:hypothetical protein
VFIVVVIVVMDQIAGYVVVLSFFWPIAHFLAIFCCQLVPPRIILRVMEDSGTVGANGAKDCPGVKDFLIGHDRRWFGHREKGRKDGFVRKEGVAGSCRQHVSTIVKIIRTS